VALIYVGAAMAAGFGVVSGLTIHNARNFSFSSTSSPITPVSDARSLTAGILMAVVYGSLWLWMAWKTGASQAGTRVLPVGRGPAGQGLPAPHRR